MGGISLPVYYKLIAYQIAMIIKTGIDSDRYTDQ